MVLTSNEDTQAYYLTTVEDEDVDNIMPLLSYFEEATLILQKENLTISEARSVFDVIEEDYGTETSKSSYLYCRSSLLNDPNFEIAVVEIQNHKGHLLDRLQQQTVMKLIKPSKHIDEVLDFEKSSFEESFREKRRKISFEEPITTKSYINTSFIPPTSNICERLFSKAKIIYGSQRHRLDVESFECQLYLHVNREYWDVNTVAETMPAQYL